MRAATSLVATLVLAAGLAPRAAAADAPVQAARRFALIVGANDGGPGRVRLRYATSDARAVARVFGDLGGIAGGDRLLLLDPGRAALLEGLERLRAAVARGRPSGARLEVLFYYSGHSDEQGLMLGGERVGYDELRVALAALPADVHLAILDSCSSGAMTRRKGGTHRPPFLFDDGTKVTGHAYLTSASMDEAAQESDRIRGSFFTHFLVSGLRGAADLSRDRRVTLNEAYQFAFNETLARTERTQGGAQHPSYDIQLAGSGDLVLTDLRGTAATMVLEADLAGRLSVRDRGGHLVAELTKPAGRAIELGLDPGEYRVTLDQPPVVLEARLQLVRGGRTSLTRGLLAAQAAEPVARRGDADAEATAEPGPRRYRHVPFSLSIVPELSLSGGDFDAINNVALAAVYGRCARLDGVGIAGGASFALEHVHGLQLSGAFNVAGRRAGGAPRAWRPLAGVLTARLDAAGGHVRGAQVSGGANFALADVYGLQVAGGFNLAADVVRGLQVAGGFNWSTARVEGLQMAGGLNFAEELVGAQVAGGVNAARLARGAQIGVVNVGGDVTGAQIGVVNVARRVRGAQIGVVNVAEDSSAPVGLVNAIKHGEHRVELWGTETVPLALGLRLGGRHVYGVLTAGLNPGTEKVRSAFGGGLGVHTGAGALAVDVEALSLSVRDGERLTETGQLSTLRVLAGYRLAGRLEVFAGPSFNVFVSRDRQSPDVVGLVPEKVYTTTNHTVRLWPGLVAGLRI